MLEGDRAVEAKLGRRGVERCDRHRVVEDVVKPAELGWLRHDVQLRADEPEIVALARPEHHAMLAESDRFRISVDGDVPDGQKPHLARATADATFGRVPDLVRPHGETGERVGTERVADRHVRRIASAGDEHAADPRSVVPRIERVPVPSDIGLEPGGEIHRAKRRRNADVAEIAGAVAGRNVHAAAEGDRQMRVVAAHAFAFLETPPRPFSSTGHPGS